ncbi:MAG: acetolactate synthase small subunit [Clostridia bacterium]|nr:acetolactate synthase small subunit [Clostridia bacterium]
MKHTISILVENQAGVLARIAGLFARRAYNIDSLAVGVTEDERISRVTIVAEGSEHTLEQILKQLNKLIDVIKVRTVSEQELLSRELVLVKVNCTPAQRAELISIAEISEAKISDISVSTMTLELSDYEGKIRTFEELLRPYGIKEIVRTGTIAIQRGSVSLTI